jgi:hypothetical protein
MNVEKKELTPEEAEDILAARLARIFVDQILEENEKKRENNQS